MYSCMIDIRKIPTVTKACVDNGQSTHKFKENVKQDIQKQQNKK